MSSFAYRLLGFSLLHAAVAGSFHYREGILQLPLLLLYVIWLGLLFTSLVRLPWKGARGRVASSALLLCLLSAPFVGAWTGIAIRDAVFRSRLAEYAAAVDAIRAGNTPSVIPRLAERVAAITSSNAPEVIFYWGSGFPSKHTAFIYRTTTPRHDTAFQQAWPSIRSLAPDWYVVKD